jgi:hypothetical protein
LPDDGCGCSWFGWSVASATSITDALRGAKKFLVGTSSWILILVSLGPGAGFDFFACSSEVFRLRLHFSLNSSGESFYSGKRESLRSLCMAA